MKWIILIIGIIGFFLVALTNNPFAIFAYFGLYLCSTIAIFQYFFSRVEAPTTIQIISENSMNKENSTN
ncbi:MAG: hypothetical protein DRO88_01690 [Promethearchaeia archaeon]|nr:MAG: hypothetical protein DRO88_01690 [Candidatus Lokiarchaeia archaeon]